MIINVQNVLTHSARLVHHEVANLASKVAVTLVFAAALVVGGQSASHGQPPAAGQYRNVEDALVVFHRGNLDGALQLLKSAEEKHAELPPAEVMMARFCFAHDQAPLGKQWLQKAVAESPDDPEAYLLLANIASQSGDFAGADSMFSRAAELAQKMLKEDVRQQRLSIAALAGMAGVDEQRQLWKNAEQHLRDWAALEPKNDTPKTRLARVLFLQEKYDDARATFVQSANADPKATLPEVQMGLLYEQAGKRDLAKQEMEAAAEKRADDLTTRVAVAQWALYAGELKLAQTNVEAAAKLDAKQLVPRLLQGIIHRFNGDHAKAEIVFRALHSEAPANFDVTNHLALSLTDQKDETKQQQAVEYAKLNAATYRDLKTRPGRIAAATLAWAILRTGNQSTAQQVIEQVLKTGQFPPQVGYYAAEIYAAADANEVALKLANAAVQSPRAFPEKAAASQLIEKLKATATKPSP